MSDRVTINLGHLLTIACIGASIVYGRAIMRAQINELREQVQVIQTTLDGMKAAK